MPGVKIPEPDTSQLPETVNALSRSEVGALSSPLVTWTLPDTSRLVSSSEASMIPPLTRTLPFTVKSYPVAPFEVSRAPAEIVKPGVIMLFPSSFIAPESSTIIASRL